MSEYFRMPHKLKNGPLYSVIDVSCTIVTVIGYGNVLSTILPITLLLDDIIYHIIHNASTLKIRFVLSVVILTSFVSPSSFGNNRFTSFCIKFTTTLNTRYSHWSQMQKEINNSLSKLKRNKQKLKFNHRSIQLNFIYTCPVIGSTWYQNDREWNIAYVDDKVKVNKYFTSADSHGFHSFLLLLFKLFEVSWQLKIEKMCRCVHSEYEFEFYDWIPVSGISALRLSSSSFLSATEPVDVLMCVRLYRTTARVCLFACNANFAPIAIAKQNKNEKKIKKCYAHTKLNPHKQQMTT